VSADNVSAAITVAPAGPDEFLVTVAGARKTEHRVSVSADDVRRYAPEGTGVPLLLHESFRFLLEREPNTSILSQFELSVIEQYFPEYPEEIRRRLSSTGGSD